MDPLTIASGAASLAVSAATISVWLGKLVREVRNIDAKVVSLSTEVTRLASLLSSVERTVRQCQTGPLALAHLDEDMWKQISTALDDCNLGVEALTRVITKINGEPSTEARSLARLLHKPSTHFRLAMLGDDVSDLTRKIYRSNCSMQTALAVVNVSLTFRTHASQESLFSELRNLKLLVEESLKAATFPHDEDAEESDPLAAQQSRNLQSLAAAAEKFHSAASSTASTRYSSHWGSEAGGPRLTLAQRERIELWNDRHTVAESILEGSPTHPVATSPVEFPNPGANRISPELGKETGLGAGLGNLALDDEDDDDDDTSSGSDVESDFLRNFEALAYASFQGGNYSKAEQLLRMAVEQSTGDRSDAVDFKSLKLKLALCCCLQEKWDHAAGIVASLPKARTPANLPIFHLLQAMSMAHLVGNRCDDAYAVCKSALNGKKKILGRASADYYGCLAVFAAICEKRGNALEAEAVRHSIPEGWLSRSGAAGFSPTQYILEHATLIQSVFSASGTSPGPSDSGRPLTQQQDNPPVSAVTQTSTNSLQWSAASGHWSTLLPPAQRDGVEAAKRAEGSGAIVEETDTGKELSTAQPEEAVTTTAHPGVSLTPTPPRQPPPPIPPSRPRAEFSSIAQGYPFQGSPGASQSSFPAPSIQVQSPPFIEQMGSVSQGAEYVSTLEALPDQDQAQNKQPPQVSLLRAHGVAPPQDITAPSPTSPRLWHVTVPLRHSPSPGPSRTRWIVPRDISNIGERRPVGALGPPEVLFMRPRHLAQPNPRSVGVAVMPDAPDNVAIGFGDNEIMVWEVPTNKSAQQAWDNLASRESGVSGMMKLLRRVTSRRGRETNPVGGVKRHRLRSKDPGDHPLDLSAGGLALLIEDQVRIERVIADRLRDPNASTESAAGAAVRVDTVVCAMPCIDLYPAAWAGTSEVMAGCPLFQHAKLISFPAAAMQYFLDIGDLTPPRPSTSSQVLALTCTDSLVECSPFTLQAPSPNVVKVTESDMMYMAECTGLAEVNELFLQLAKRKMDQMNGQLKQKLSSARIDTIVQQCLCEWYQTILPDFCDRGRSWIVTYDAPIGFTAFRHGMVDFENDEIRDCFTPTISLITGMLKQWIRRMRASREGPPSHIILIGSYTKSRYLIETISKVLRDEASGDWRLPAKLVYADGGVDPVSLGALVHAKWC